MKLSEIMIIRNDGLKLFRVDDSTLSKLSCIRGNLYRDDHRLRVMADMPQQTPEMSPEMQARAGAAFTQYLASKAVTATPSPAMQSQPMTFEEKLRHDWKTSPAIRAEFVSMARYAAYKRAAEAGRCKVYGGA